MSEDPNAAAAAVGDTTAAPPPNVTPAGDTKPAPPASLLSGATEDLEPDAPPVTTDWPEDWRERWAKAAGNDEQALKTLKRWLHPDNVFKSWLDFRKKQGAGLLAPSLPDDASEEEIESYRKAAGIPETPDGYELGFPEGIEASDDAKAELAAFSEAAHALHAPPVLLKRLWGKYLELKQQDGQKLYETVRQAKEDARVELRAEWGRDYDRNRRVARGFLATHLGGDEAAEELVSLRLDNGISLGDYPPFVRAMTAAGLASMGQDQIVEVESGGGGKTLDEQIREGMEVFRTDPRKYDTPEFQKKMEGLFEARRLREVRQGRAA